MVRIYVQINPSDSTDFTTTNRLWVPTKKQQYVTFNNKFSGRRSVDCGKLKVNIEKIKFIHLSCRQNLVLQPIKINSGCIYQTDSI